MNKNTVGILLVVGVILFAGILFYSSKISQEQVASVKSENFSLLSSTGDEATTGARYVFGGTKSLDMYYKHDTHDAFGDYICFTPFNAKDLTYPDLVETRGALCTEVSENLVTLLGKTSVPFVESETGSQVRASFEGSANVSIDGYVIDTRATETVNRISIVGVNKLYK